MDDMYIKIDSLSFAYGRYEPVLENISFCAKAGESIGLVGANGAGKSTLLKLIVGLELDYQGQLCVAGMRMEKKNLPKIREKTGYVFQDSESQLFMPTVYDDVAFGPYNYGLSGQQVQQRANEALEQVGALHLKDRPACSLSGGQKKLVSIATVLAMQPEAILMDEPSAALDPGNRRNLIRLLNSFGQLKLIASHDLDFILDTCERTLLIAGGRIVRDGPAEQILTDRELLESCGLELPLSLYGNRVRAGQTAEPAG